MRKLRVIPSEFYELFSHLLPISCALYVYYRARLNRHTHMPSSQDAVVRLCRVCVCVSNKKHRKESLEASYTLHLTHICFTMCVHVILLRESLSPEQRTDTNPNTTEQFPHFHARNFQRRAIIFCLRARAPAPATPDYL